MFSKENILKIMDFVMVEASGFNAHVLVTASNNGLTRFANSEIHQNVQTSSLSATITINQGTKSSKISTDICTENGLREAVKEAIHNLNYLPEGQELSPLLSGIDSIIEIKMNKDLQEKFNIENRALLVGKCIDKLDEDYKAFGALSYNERIIGVANSKGIRHIAGNNSVDFTALIDHGDNCTGFAALSSDSPENLNIESAFDRAYNKAKLNTNRTTIEPGTYTVILEPLAVGEILTYLSFIGFSAKSVQNKISFLTGKIGQKIFADTLTITDDFTDPNTLGLPFDFEGAKRTKVTLIEKGVSKGLIYDTASAEKDGVETTGHSLNSPAYGGMPLNLVISAGDESLEEMIANTENGLLVTRFHYINPINPRIAQLTGLTRDGLFQIKDGKIVGAVNNMRFTESFLEAFNKIEGVSKERERIESTFRNSYVPALKIKDFHFTGKTDLPVGKA